MTERPGGLTRRDFLRLGAVTGPVSILAACGWEGGSAIEPKLRSFSRLNDWVGERIFQSSHRLGREYPASARTPMDNFPSYSITYNRTGSYPSPPSSREWSLEVGGLVGKPARLTRSAIERLPSLTYTVKHHCVEGWTAIASWTGVPVSTIIAMVQPTDQAGYIKFESFDSGYSNGWDLKSAVHPQTILAYAYNDRPLMMNHGAPLRLYSPIKLGYKLTKYLTGMTFTRERPGGYWEDRGYPWFGGI
jgi:DMSO/TMAO reductase YedYZ molybdopterin-dependent catalytic subunit